MTAHTILWIYIGLLIGGGIMGLIKGGSKISLITSVAFAIPLILCEFDVLPFRFATWILLLLLVVFAWRLSRSRKFMPMGLLLVLTLAALAGLWSQSKGPWPGGPRLGLAQPILWSLQLERLGQGRGIYAASSFGSLQAVGSTCTVRMLKRPEGRAPGQCANAPLERTFEV